MRYIIFLLASVAIFLACNTASVNVSDSFTPEKLETLKYEINTDRDTTLQTTNGALLKIPKGALSAKNGNTVNLEIKEGLTIEQMIRGGLITQSNGKPLSSGGMIYIGTAAGQEVTFNKPIQVAIPSDFIDKDMKLFEGKVENGNLNWIDPTPLPVNAQLATIDTGQMLFLRKCSSCHAIGKDIVGPDLAHFMKRFSPESANERYYYSHLYPDRKKERLVLESDEARRIDSVVISDIINNRDTGNYDYNFPEYQHPEYMAFDLYRCNLKAMFPSKGPEFPNLTDEEVLRIFRYIQNESDRRNLSMPSHDYLKSSVDSCISYSKRVSELKEKKIFAKLKKAYLKADNGPLVKVTPDTTWPVAITPPPPDFEEKVSPKNFEAVYYQFSVESFGWKNIDVLLDEKENVQQSELFVKIGGQIKEKVSTFLIIPSVKVYGKGGPADRNSEEFAFFYKDGSLPLPQGVKAYILAMTETEADESIAFGLKEFTTSTKQELTVELHKSTKQEFTAAMQQFDVQRLHIKVDDAKNADEIRKTITTLKEIDQQLKDAENLKPKRCDCHCGEEDRPVVAADSAATNPIVNNRMPKSR